MIFVHEILTYRKSPPVKRFFAKLHFGAPDGCGYFKTKITSLRKRPLYKDKEKNI